MIKKIVVYFVKAQIVRGTIESCVRAGVSQESCVRAGDSQTIAYEQAIHKSHVFESMDGRNKTHEYELDIHRFNACEQESYQSLAYEHRIHVYKLKDCKFLICHVSDAIIQPIVEDPLRDDRILVEAGAKPVPIPCKHFRV